MAMRPMGLKPDASSAPSLGTLTTKAPQSPCGRLPVASTTSKNEARWSKASAGSRLRSAIRQLSGPPAFFAE